MKDFILGFLMWVILLIAILCGLSNDYETECFTDACVGCIDDCTVE